MSEKKLLLLTIIIVPAWVSYLLRVLAWKVILGSTGILASFITWIGLDAGGSAFLLYSSDAVTVTLIYVWIPFVALPIFAALERIDPHLLEAAADLGCTKVFFRINFDKQLADNKELTEGTWREGAGIKMSLGLMDSTYFISAYLNGRKIYTVPILEVSKELIRYSFTQGDPMEVIAYRKIE
jgi:hypothetical protein